MDVIWHSVDFQEHPLLIADHAPHVLMKTPLNLLGDQRTSLARGEYDVIEEVRVGAGHVEVSGMRFNDESIIIQGWCSSEAASVERRA
jgi:hypothetical protein